LEAVVNVATELKEKSSFLPRTLDFSRGGGKDIADILSTMGQDEEDKFLSAISLENPELAKEVKKYHLTFENIFEFFPDNLIRDIMNSVDLDDIATALKGMSEEDVNRVINNLPKKKQAMYEPKEGALSKREVERARKKIVEQARIMEKDGAFSLQDLTGSGEMIE
jgi:flagellar motor switch protein FliG